jgi:thiol-disulfide isomerase/thioredoxin
MDEDSVVALNSVQGIEYVRPPTLDFLKVKENDEYTEYKVVTKKNSKKKADPKKGCPGNPFTNYLDSFIFCKPTLNIKFPKKEFMVKDGKRKFAYAVGMFPNPKNGKAAYLDGCILAALGLRRQNTNADIICFITPDISKKDKEKLEVVFDKVMYVPYISPRDYEMPEKTDEGETYKTIHLDKKLFDNCPNYTKEHPYVHVFFKLHIFNPELFPYEKVCFVDSDLVPLNYYDSLFMLDCPAGFVEYRKKAPYLESYQWDRCDFLEHGKPIPKELTDIDKPTGADVNAGLLLVKPNKKEYESMIKELSSPLETWMGPKKKHKGFYSFDFDSPTGMEFVKNSYCYPEQNYLTKRYSGKWKFIEFAFQSWSRDPCNSFGIHMAAFNPKPWFKQPIGTIIKTNEKYQPYLRAWDKKNVRFPLAIEDGSGENYDNISYSYEIFNEVIIWGMVNYPKLAKFFTYDTQIHGTKVSFDRDVFKELSPKQNLQFKYLKDIKKGDDLYKRLSKSQKQISDLINNYDASVKKIKDNYLQVCRDKVKDKNNQYNYNFQIIEYENYQTKSENKIEDFLDDEKFPFGEMKGKEIKELDDDFILSFIRSNAYMKNKTLRDLILKYHKDLIKKNKKGGKKKTKRKTTKRKTTKRKKTIRKKNIRKNNKKHIIHYFSADWCGYCRMFNPQWDEIVNSYPPEVPLSFEKTVIDDNNQHLLQMYNIQSFPSIILEKSNGVLVRYPSDKRTKKDIDSFLRENEIKV